MFEYVISFMNEFYLHCPCYFCDCGVHPLMETFYLILSIWTNLTYIVLKKKNPSYLTFAIYKRGSSVNGISFYQLHSSKLKTIIYLSLVKDVPSHCSSLNWIVRLARFIHRFEIFCMHIFPIH